MEVILLEPVRHLGQMGDIVKVRDGFGRNFLIPNRKALRATKENRKLFEARKAEIANENKQKQSGAEALAKKLQGKVVTVIRQAGEDGRLFGSVTSGDVSKAIAQDLKETVDRKLIVLDTPIKYIGVHTVELRLHGEITAKIHPNVSRSETEAKEAKVRFDRGETVMEGQDKRRLFEAAEETPGVVDVTEPKAGRKRKVADTSASEEAGEEASEAA